MTERKRLKKVRNKKKLSIWKHRQRSNAKKWLKYNPTKGE